MMANTHRTISQESARGQRPESSPGAGPCGAWFMAARCGRPLRDRRRAGRAQAARVALRRRDEHALEDLVAHAVERERVEPGVATRGESDRYQRPHTRTQPDST